MGFNFTESMPLPKDLDMELLIKEAFLMVAPAHTQPLTDEEAKCAAELYVTHNGNLHIPHIKGCHMDLYVSEDDGPTRVSMSTIAFTKGLVDRVTVDHTEVEKAITTLSRAFKLDGYLATSWTTSLSDICEGVIFDSVDGLSTSKAEDISQAIAQRFMKKAFGAEIK